MRKSKDLKYIKDELACMRLAAKRKFEGAVLDRVNGIIDDVGSRWLAFGREPNVVTGGSVQEGLLSTAVYGLRMMVAKANGVTPPPSPTAEMTARMEAAKAKRDAVAARRTVREELRQADLDQSRAERKATRDALPRPLWRQEALPDPGKPMKKPEPAPVDPNQLNLF